MPVPEHPLQVYCPEMVYFPDGWVHLDLLDPVCYLARHFHHQDHHQGGHQTLQEHHQTAWVPVEGNQNHLGVPEVPVGLSADPAGQTGVLEGRTGVPEGQAAPVVPSAVLPDPVAGHSPYHPVLDLK